jgi:transcriptional regulator with XRE-family HTH domain
MQYPPLDFYSGNNPDMDINDIIAANIAAWRQSRPDVILEDIAKKADVGYGTIQRAARAEGNPTLKNLVAMARLFGMTPAGLLTDQSQCDKAQNITPPPVDSKEIEVFSDARVVSLAAERRTAYAMESTLEKEILGQVKAMSEIGQAVLLGMAKVTAAQYPKQYPVKEDRQ